MLALSPRPVRLWVGGTPLRSSVVSSVEWSANSFEGSLTDTQNIIYFVPGMADSARITLGDKPMGVCLGGSGWKGSLQM